MRRAVDARSEAAPDPARAVARAVLYEGYVLWPYRKSALKNQRRWTFGGVHPRGWTERGHEDDVWWMETACLVGPTPRRDRTKGPVPTVQIRARFLQVVERQVARVRDGDLEYVDRLDVAGQRWTAWDEAREREVVLPPLELRDGARATVPVRIAAGTELDWIDRRSGEHAGAVLRSWRDLRGELSVTCASVGEWAFRLTARLSNTSPWEGGDREDALRSTFASTHLVLRADGADFFSLTDPPRGLIEAVDGCRNEGWWPVLVGARGSSDTMLASPIILPDYPVIAPESPGDFFDGGEIDEMLALHVLALTDEEKEEMRATDPRTRDILERTTAMARDQLMGLHGTFRDGRTGDPRPAGMAEDAPDPFWVEMGRPGDRAVVIDGARIGRGSRVRLHPDPGGDVMDVALADRIAVVEGIDEDQDGGVHLTVVVEGDPGLDLGMARMPGHRFFFRPEEVEPVRTDP